MAGTATPTRRLVPALVLTTALLACASAGCVVWPEGSGSKAGPMPLAEALARSDRGEAVLVDVRSRASYAEGHLPGALSIPFDELASEPARVRSLRKLPVLYCG